MTDTTAPAGERYATDLTHADVAELSGWLKAVLGVELRDAPDGTPANRLAFALHALVDDVVDAANSHIKMRDARTPTPDDDEFTGLENLHAIRRAWGQLVSTAQQWDEHPGYDGARWRRVETNPVLSALHRERNDKIADKIIAAQG
ncbi:hypothetical protein ACIRRH_35555 [Kitasatospora sp. NPDC101235]|uniref:hypothetical protein n=1 Tax=Kitasatospora sp. NPDC101235 TaxID=3364101 RepID=UPI0038145DB4